MENDPGRELAILSEVSRMLAEATTVEEVKDVRDKAEAIRAYVRNAQLGLEIYNKAAEARLRAERKAGQLLNSMSLRGGDRRSKLPRGTLKLVEIGVSRKQSMRWQCIAMIPDEDFAAYLHYANQFGLEVTSAGLLRMAGALNSQRRQKGRKIPMVVDGVPYVQLSAGSDETIQELSDHCSLLTDVLRPICEELDVELKRAEKRLVGRLLREMIELIRRLKTSTRAIDKGRG